MAADLSDLRRNMEQGTQVLTDFADHATSTVAIGTMLGTAFEKVGEAIVQAMERAVEAVPELVSHTIELGNQLFEMSMKTGASVEHLSALRYVAGQSGVEFESLTTAFFKMEASLGTVGAKADTLGLSLSKVGLNMQDLKNARPDEAFIQIVSALEKTGNAADRNALAMQLFGRGAKEMAGLFREDIKAMIQDATDLGLIMTTETAASAHAAQVGWNALSMQFEAAANAVAVQVLPALVAIEQLISGEFKAAVDRGSLSVGHLQDTVVGIVQTLLRWADTAVSVAQFIDDAFQGTKALFFGFLGVVVDLLAGFVHIEEAAVNLATKVPLLGGQFTQLRDTLKDSQTWLAGFADGLKQESSGALDSARAHHQLFDSIHGGIADLSVNFPKALDAAGAKIAEFAAKSKSAGDTVASSIGLDPTVLAAQLAETTKLWDQYYKAVNAAGHDTVARQIDDVWLAADAQIAAIEKTKAITVEDYAIIWMTAEQTANNIIQKTLESDKYTREHYQLLADQAAAAYQFALDHASSYTNLEIQMLADKYREAAMASNHWAATAYDDLEKVGKAAHKTAASVGAAVISVMDTMTMADAAFANSVTAQIAQVQTLAGEWIKAADAKKQFDAGNSITYNLSTTQGVDAYRAMNPGMNISWSNQQIVDFAAHGGTLQQLMAMGIIKMKPYAMDFTGSGALGGLPHFASGVQNFSGGLALVGEDGPELLDLPRGSSVIPNRLLGGGSSVTFMPGAIAISGVLATDQVQIQRLVEDAFMRVAKTTHSFGAA